MSAVVAVVGACRPAETGACRLAETAASAHAGPAAAVQTLNDALCREQRQMHHSAVVATAGACRPAEMGACRLAEIAASASAEPAAALQTSMDAVRREQRKAHHERSGRHGRSLQTC